MVHSVMFHQGVADIVLLLVERFFRCFLYVMVGASTWKQRKHNGDKEQKSDDVLGGQNECFINRFVSCDIT